MLAAATLRIPTADKVVLCVARLGREMPDTHPVLVGLGPLRDDRGRLAGS
jgi:hypothetical protein